MSKNNVVIEWFSVRDQLPTLPEPDDDDPVFVKVLAYIPQYGVQSGMYWEHDGNYVLEPHERFVEFDFTWGIHDVTHWAYEPANLYPEDC